MKYLKFISSEGKCLGNTSFSWDAYVAMTEISRDIFATNSPAKWMGIELDGMDRVCSSRTYVRCTVSSN